LIEARVNRSRRIPEATVGRLPIYLRALKEIDGKRAATVSSDELARLSGVNAAKVRKDLSYLGTYGIRGVGYDAKLLVMQISRELGLTKDWPVALIGFGNLGRALAGYRGFGERGFQIAAIFDTDPAKVGVRIGDLVVRHLRELSEIARREQIAIAMIATPAAEAQGVADHVVEAGITSILNFAPCFIRVPPRVSIRKVDLSMELQILSFYQQGKAVDALRS
jgi:redox-sensing transcriptional repressor